MQRWELTSEALCLVLCRDQSTTLLDGSSRSTLKAKLAASSARIAASLPTVPIPQPLPRASVASALQSLTVTSPQPAPILSTPSTRNPRSPATMPSNQSNSASLSSTRPSLVSASKETLSVGDETPAVRKERARLDKQEKQRQKQDKKVEQKAAKEERRLSKRVEKEASQREQEQQAAEVKSKEAEEQKSREALQAVARAASSSVQLHTPPASLGGSIVDELSDYLAASSLTGITQHLDQHFEQMLDSKRAKPVTAQSAVQSAGLLQQHSQPPPGFAPLASSSTPLPSLLLTAEDEARSARIDFDKLDRAKPSTQQQPPPPRSQQLQPTQLSENGKTQQAVSNSEHKQHQLHEEEEDEDYQRYQQQQAAQLITDDGGEYEQIAEGRDTEAADRQDSGGNWDDQLDDEDDSKRDVSELNIDALNLQDVTEDEIILAMVREFEAKQAADDGVTHDVSTADMTQKLRTYLLDQQEEGPDDFDRHSASEKRRQTRANETEEQRRERKEAKYKQRAQDAAEGILDWDWSSDSDTSASDGEEGAEEGDEEDEAVSDEDGQLDNEENEVDQSDEDDDDDDNDDEEEDKSDDSTEARGKDTRVAVCTCFKPLSPHDPAIIAAQLESFVSSDVSSQYHTHSLAPM